MTRFNVGDRVAQPQYGAGTIAAVNDFHTTIDFDDHGRRTFATNLVQLEPSAIPAPPPAPKRARKRAAVVAKAPAVGS